jgi:hypothetical protein
MAKVSERLAQEVLLRLQTSNTLAAKLGEGANMKKYPELDLGALHEIDPAALEAIRSAIEIAAAWDV